MLLVGLGVSAHMGAEIPVREPVKKPDAQDTGSVSPFARNNKDASLPISPGREDELKQSRFCLILGIAMKVNTLVHRCASPANTFFLSPIGKAKTIFIGFLRRS